MLEAPQVIMLIAMGIHVGKHVTYHAKPRVEKHHGPLAILSVVLYGALLTWGGFFG